MELINLVGIKINTFICYSEYKSINRALYDQMRPLVLLLF
jgi:hypothetical protein